MKSITEDTFVVSLISRLKFLEISYFEIHSICSKIFALKCSDSICESKLSQLKVNFKTLSRPELIQEDSRDSLIQIISSAKTDLGSSIHDKALFDSIWPTVEKTCSDIFEYTIGRAVEKYTKPKAVYTKIEKIVQKAEKKLETFQKEARKLSAERRNEVQEIAPVRNNVTRSVSSADKQTFALQQKNAELSEQLKSLRVERDVLKAWKENVLKLPGNFSEDSNTIIKEQETCKKQLTTQNKVLTSKLSTIYACVNKFLKDTSVFQKIHREKEGFSSVNFYEDEKYKLEMKLRELVEVKEPTPITSPTPSPSRKNHLSVDLTQFTKKPPSFESENKVLKTQLRDYKKSLKTLEIKYAELENTRWQFEKERQTLERKVRNTSANPSNIKKFEMNYQKAIESTKQYAECKIAEVTRDLEQKYAIIQQKLSEKENSFNELRSRFTESLKENLNTLIAMNEDLRNSNSEKSNDSVRVQLENLEYIIEQNRAYSEIKIQELNETIELLDSERSSLIKSKKVLEKENLHLKSEVNKGKDLESNLRTSKIMMAELEENNKMYSSTIRHLKQNELKIDQITFEKAMLKADISKLAEEIAQKDKYIIELQETLKSEEHQANSCLEDLIFKEKAAKSQIEMLKIDISNYQSEIDALYESQKSYTDHIKFLEQRCSSNVNLVQLTPSGAKNSVHKSTPVSPLISENSVFEPFGISHSALNIELEEERKFNLNNYEQMKVLKDHIRELEREIFRNQQLKTGGNEFFKDTFYKLVKKLPVINGEIEEIITAATGILNFTNEEISKMQTSRGKI